MTHASATSFCIWSVLSTALGAFLLGHLWRFDRFKCIRWSNTPYSGAFKRFMTYTYLITIPLIMIYSFGFTYIKYKEGFMDIEGQIMVKPYIFWSPGHRRAIFPLMLVFSFAWSFEMITHLEELCFWLFLITARSQTDWFKSKYFRLWAVGSIGAFVYVPIVTIVSRNDPLANEARTFVAGSSGDFLLTIAFIPILWYFPRFMRKVKEEHADTSVVIKLRKFYELNIIRIVFRFLMHIPLLTLGTDGLRPHSHVNENMFWTDLLSIIAGLGCICSSVCTLLIFFPRSYESEYQADENSQHEHVHKRHSLKTRFSNFSRSPYHSPMGTPKSFSTGASQHSSVRTRPRRAIRLPFRRHTESADPQPDQRRTTPTARSRTIPTKLVCSSSDQIEDYDMNASGTELVRKNTYLLTDSPVARALNIGSAGNVNEFGNSDVENDPLDLEDSDARTLASRNGPAVNSLKMSNYSSRSKLRGPRSPQKISRSPVLYSPSERTNEQSVWVDEDVQTKCSLNDRGVDSGAGDMEVSVVDIRPGGGRLPHVVALPELRNTPPPASAHEYTWQAAAESNDTTRTKGGRGHRVLPSVPAVGSMNPHVDSRAAANFLTTTNVQQHNNRHSRINPFVHMFTSPIDLMRGRRETPDLP